MSIITFSQAVQNYEENNNRNAIKFHETIEEIKTSDFSVLSFLDVQHYTNVLNETNPDKKADKYTANDVRRMNVREQNDHTSMMMTFIDSDNDDIFDFF